MADLRVSQLVRHLPLLQEQFLFQGLPEEELPALLCMPGTHIARIPAGKPLLPQEGYAPLLGILLRGAAVVEKYIAPDDPTAAALPGILRVSELAPGALYGMASLFLGEAQRPFPTRITALKSCAALIIPEDTFRSMLQQNFRLAENYIRYLTERIYFLNTRIDGLILPTVPQRLLLYLQQNAVDGCLHHSLTQLAQALNISRATLYRALEALEQAGSIRREGRRIELLG